MYSADTLPNWHGGHRCLLQPFFCHNSWLASPAEHLRRCYGCNRRLLQTLPQHLSEPPANTLLPDLSPATPVDFLHYYHKLVNVYCRLGAMLQPSPQCLQQTFCCSSRHRYLLQIYLRYCPSTQQCILQVLHTATMTLPDVHGAHFAFLSWRSHLAPALSKLLLNILLQAVYFALTEENFVVYLLFGYTITPSPLSPLVECKV